MAYLKFLPHYPNVTPQLVRKGPDHYLCLRRAGRGLLCQMCRWPPKQHLYQLNFKMCLGNIRKQFFSPHRPPKPHRHTHHQERSSGNLQGAPSLARRYHRFESSNIPDDLMLLFSPLFSGKEDSSQKQGVFVTLLLGYPAAGLVDTERGTAAPLGASSLTLHSGTCPALPHFYFFFRERGKEDALTYVNGRWVNSQVPASFRSGLLLAVTSGNTTRHFQVLSYSSCERAHLWLSAVMTTL